MVCAMFKIFLSFKRFLIIQFVVGIVDKVDADSTSFKLAKCRLASSRFRNFCQIFEGFGFGKFGFKKIWSRKKVLVSVLENLVSEKKKSK